MTDDFERDDEQRVAEDQTSPSGQDDVPATMTGDPVVDEVLRSMQDLQGRPVEEHVAVFEAAHEKLRAALTDAGRGPASPGR